MLQVQDVLDIYEHFVPEVMAGSLEVMAGSSEHGGFKWTEELTEKYGDHLDPTAKAYVPPGWKTCYLWRAPDLWMAMNSEWMTKTFMMFAALFLIHLKNI